MGLTDDQAKDLAQRFREIADSLKYYKLKSWDSLSPDQHTLINETQLRLYEYSQKMITQVVERIIDEAQCSLEDLRHVIKNANYVINNLQKVTQVIKVVEAINGLAITIINNPIDIISAIEKLTKSMESAGK